MSCNFSSLMENIGKQFKSVSNNIAGLFKPKPKVRCTLCNNKKAQQIFYVEKQDNSVVLCVKCFTQSQKQTNYLAIKNQEQLQKLRIQSLQFDSQEQIELDIPVQSLVLDMQVDKSQITSRTAIQESILVTYLPDNAVHTLNDQFEKALKKLQGLPQWKGESEKSYMRELMNLLGPERVEKHSGAIKEQIGKAIQSNTPRQIVLNKIIQDYLTD